MLMESLVGVLALVAATALVNEERSRSVCRPMPPSRRRDGALAGGFLSIRDIFLPMALHPRVSGEAFKGWLNSDVTAVMMALALAVGGAGGGGAGGGSETGESRY